MAERTTVVESSDPPQPQPPSDRTLDMAVEFGRLGAAYQQTQNELAEMRASQAETLDLLANQNEILSELRNQTQSAQRTAEAAQVTAAVAVETVESESEEEEDQDVLSVTPEVETHVQIDQVPVKQRKWIHNLIYGK